MKSKSFASLLRSLSAPGNVPGSGFAHAWHHSVFVLAAGLAALLGPSSARAATLYWDLNGSTANTAMAVSGAWNGVNVFWNSDAAGAAAGVLQATTTSADDVVFSSAALYTTGTVTASGSPAVSSITFEDNIVTTLAGALNVGGTGTKSGIFGISGANANSTVSGAVNLTANATLQNAGLGVIALSGGLGGAANLVINNNAGTLNGITISGGGANHVGTITNSGTAAGSLISGPIGTNVTGVTQNSANSFLTLSGTNTYSSGTSINLGALSFVNTTSLPGTGTVTVAAGATLGLGVSSATPFSAADLENLIAGNMVGRLVNVSLDPASFAGIDTTGADYTYTPALTTSRTLHKLGTSTLTLSGNNAASTAPVIVGLGGGLRISSTANFTSGSLTLVGGTVGVATLDLRNESATNFPKDVVLGGPVANALHTINVDQAVGGVAQNNTHSIGVISNSSAVARILTVGGANGYSLTIGEYRLAPGTGQTSTITANVNTTVSEVTNPMSGFANTNFDTLTLSGTSTASQVTGVIEDATGLSSGGAPASLAAGGTTRLTKSGTGTWTVRSDNTFTGRTTIGQGTLNVQSLNSVTGGTASSTLGAPTVVADATIQLGATTTAGILNYTGTGETTDRNINLAGTTGGATLTQSGTSGLLKFTRAFTATGAGIKTLTLSGSTAGTGEIAAAIVENSATNKTSLVKTGTGTWALSGANTYTGTTTVTGGSLLLDKSGVGDLAIATGLVQTAGNFGIIGKTSGFTTQSLASLTVNTGASGLTVNPNGGAGTTLTITSPTLTTAFGGSLHFNTAAGTPATAAISWNPTLTNGIIGPAYTITDNAGTGFATVTGGLVTRAAGTVLDAANPVNAATNFLTNTTGVITNTVPAAQLNTLAIDTAAGGSTWDLGTGNSASLTAGALLMSGSNNFSILNGTLNGAGTNLTLNPIGTGVLTISSTIADGSGASTLAKLGNGTAVLAGTNTYTGNTTVGSGTLVLSGSSTTSQVFLNGGTGTTLRITNAAASGPGAFTFNTGVTNANLQVYIDGGGTITLPNSLSGNSGVTTNIDVNNNGSGSNGVIQFAGTMAGSAIGNAILNITGGNGYRLQIDNLRNTGGGAGTLQLNPTTTTVSLGNATVNPGVSTTTGTYAVGLGGTSTGNTVTGIISDNSAGPALNSVIKSNTGSWTLSGANTYTGATTISGGTLINGSANTFTAKGTLSMSADGIFELGGFDASFTNFAASSRRNLVTNRGATDAVLNFSALNATISSLITDGTTNKLGITVSNANSAANLFRLDSPNTFSGGITLTGGGAAVLTRLRIWSGTTGVPGVIVNNGTAGAIVSSPFGTGPIILGSNNADRGGIMVNDLVPGSTILNDLVINTTLGNDNRGIRVENTATGLTLAGRITANQANAVFTSANGAVVTLTGKVTGSFGLETNNINSNVILRLNNAASDNDYAGNTIVGYTSPLLISTLALDRSNQIPHGAGKGDLVNAGRFHLNGFSETLNGLSGSGVVDGLSGTPTLTVGDNNATDAANTFNGVITNSAGALALTKIGTGTLTLNGLNTYAGPTTVLAGVLATSGSSLPDNGTLILNGGMVASAGNEIVSALFFGNVKQADGTWGATGSGAANIDNVRFSGPGVINVIPAAPASSFAGWAAAFTAPPLSNPAAGADPDGDGLPNAVEYVLGTDPRFGSPSGIPAVTTAGPNLVFTFNRGDLSETPDVTLTVQTSFDLMDWTTLQTYTVGATTATSTAEVTITENSTLPDLITVNIPHASAIRKYVRMKVLITP